MGIGGGGRNCNPNMPEQEDPKFEVSLRMCTARLSLKIKQTTTIGQREAK